MAKVERYRVAKRRVKRRSFVEVILNEMLVRMLSLLVSCLYGTGLVSLAGWLLSL